VIMVVNVNEVLEGHVALDIQCLDRIYLNGYVPTLQVGGHVVSFMTRHLGYRIPSPAILEKIGTAFRRSVNSFAETNHIPLIRFAKEDRKIDVMRRYMRAQERVGRSGVAAIGVAQEYQNVFASTQRQGTNGIPCFGFHKADRRVTCFYFYLWDADFGPAFIKICAYFPYPIKVWINGHEWAKRQCLREGIPFAELSNGFAACQAPQALQEICDRLGPGTIEVFFQRWLAVLPLPLTDHDADAGYWWELSMRQIEISRTLVFDAPRRARGFFEALVADNLDIGRPDSVELIFTGHAPHSRRGRPPNPGLCKTKIVTRDTEVTVNAFYKHSRIKLPKTQDKHQSSDPPRNADPQGTLGGEVAEGSASSQAPVERRSVLLMRPMRTAVHQQVWETVSAIRSRRRSLRVSSLKRVRAGSASSRCMAGAMLRPLSISTRTATSLTTVTMLVRSGLIRAPETSSSDRPPQISGFAAASSFPDSCISILPSSHSSPSQSTTRMVPKDSTRAGI
jgi:hypothetical protein